MNGIDALLILLAGIALIYGITLCTHAYTLIGILVLLVAVLLIVAIVFRARRRVVVRPE